jgi:hypothetical protein
MATPLIRIPQEQGGTMYAFSSAARDLTRAYNNPDINFEYSKFALIDIPVVATPGNGENYIQFENLFEGGAQDTPYIPGGDANVEFAETFQNYALNLENFILSDDDFDPSLFLADSEKIFFKWMNHIGALDLKNATSQYAVGGISRAIELEEITETGSNYNRLVKYIGNIDVSNDKNYQGNTYNEIFINVPSSVGFTPDVLFKSSNYNTTATSYLPSDFINGRQGQTHPDANLTLGSLGDRESDGAISLNPVDAYNYGIDFDASSYARIINDPSLNNLLDYSKRGGDFRFNAILVYYDLYSKSNSVNRSTNLYGVIILDNFKNDASSTGSYIPELTKYKPNEVTGLNGNAFALKLNVKFNSSLDNVGVESNINDYTTFSMDIFLDTTTALENAAKLMIEANSRYTSIFDRLVVVEDLLLTTAESNGVKSKLNEIEIMLENAILNYADSSSIVDMISSINNRLNQVINGVIPSEVQYNTDVLSPGNGILIDKTNPSKIKIVNNNNGYNLNDLFEFDFNSMTTGTLVNLTNKFNMTLAAANGLITRIRPFDNLLRIHTDGGIPSGDLNIYLDDSINQWKKGQTVKISFKDALINIGNNKINFYTDKNSGWKLKAVIGTSNLLSISPYIELICVDEINKTFELEIIR